MRLRYLRVQKNPPLQDVEITFNQETALGRACAINFVVGVNGSGKSRLLQVIAETFLSLSRSEMPSYPVTLAYDLGVGTNKRTLLLHHKGKSITNALLIEYQDERVDVDWEAQVKQIDSGQETEGERVRYTGIEIPRTGCMPEVLLAYTSGATDSWIALFEARRDLAKALRGQLSEQDNLELRPRSWTVQKEIDYLRADGRHEEANELRDKLLNNASSDLSKKGSDIIFIKAEDLKLALFAVALDQVVKEFHQERFNEEAEKQYLKQIEESAISQTPMQGLRGILNAVDWLWLVTVSLRISVKPEELSDSFRDRHIRERLNKLALLSSRAIREPEPLSRRLFSFDLHRHAPNREGDARTAAVLMEELGGEGATPFAVFRQLRTWRNEGVIEDVVMLLRKRNIEDYLLYDWLSDGEKVFLGRMALFHLLKEQEDALILLDEPETHFNDVWKREIVDIIDESLGNVSSNVVITTHSSIALTDVFKTEVVLLEKSPRDGSIYAEPLSIETFGASPTEIMRDVFGASDGVGQRAAQFLDLVLAVATRPDEVEAVWKMNGNNAEVLQSEQFKQLWEYVSKEPYNYQNQNFLLDVLRSVHQYTRFTFKDKIEVNVADALKALQEKLGPGYYEFEFRRRLRALKERDSNAPQN